jgi:hypothetical protein
VGLEGIHPLCVIVPFLAMLVWYHKSIAHAIRQRPEFVANELTHPAQSPMKRRFPMKKRQQWTDEVSGCPQALEHLFLRILD